MARRWVSFERVDSWRCGACQGLRERQKAEAVKRLYEAILEAVRVFEIPRSTRKSRQQRPRASRFRGSVPAGGRVWNLARRGADRDANFEPLARKMTAVRRSHLMH